MNYYVVPIVRSWGVCNSTGRALPRKAGRVRGPAASGFEQRNKPIPTTLTDKVPFACVSAFALLSPDMLELAKAAFY